MSVIYRKTISCLDKVVPQKLQPLWSHPAGPKTIFFWAPAFKWGLVIAGLGDLSRPAEKISVPQSAALSATGLVWSRYSMVIIPKNWNLFSVNVFVAITGIYQLSRAIMYECGVCAKCYFWSLWTDTHDSFNETMSSTTPFINSL